ncbi:hypothetical protein PIB30_087362 [Stylosanthes scabra]|uniref:Uncharacterized protein n=1 Tax=Stylosanthes scabra TaxID=79078 RepID=A0ABU6UV78_9FABA|nr:hypothetical protein [Stylosanthes scabra]
MAVVGGASILQKARWVDICYATFRKGTDSGTIAVTIRKNTGRLVDTKEWQYPTHTVANTAEAGMLHPNWNIQPPSEIRQIIRNESRKQSREPWTRSRDGFSSWVHH